MNIDRINWRSYALGLAWMASMRSEARTITSDGSEAPRRVGACVLGKDNRVLALGYNGFVPGFKPPMDFYRDPVKRVTHIIHAETNALVNVRRGDASLIALTLSPCAACAQQIIARDIPMVVYGEQYKNKEGLEILQFFGVELVLLPLMNVMQEWLVPGIEDYLTRTVPVPNVS